MARIKDRLFIGVGGHVVAIDPGSGTEVWRTKLKSASFVTVSLSSDRILAGAGGELFCLDPSSGTVLWHNKLKGLGLGIVAFAESGELVAEAAARAQRQSSQAASA